MTMIKIRLHILIILLMVSTTATVSAQNTDYIDFAVRRARMEPDMKHASLAVCVHDITHDSTIYALDANHALLPAALNKLFTTAAGFSRLGSDFRFKTNLVYSGTIDNRGVLTGDIVILGNGDPFLGSTRIKGTMPDTLFRAITQAIRDEGIHRINGHIYADASLFDDEMVHPTWQWNDIGNYYGSGISGLNYHENSINVRFSAGANVGDPATITDIYPANMALTLTNEVVTGPSDTASEICFFGSPSANSRICRGVLAKGVRDTLIRASLPNPALCLADQLTQYLRKHGVPVSGEASDRFEMPKRVHDLTTIQSLYYRDIAKLTNYTTNNMCAEGIFKYLGYYQDGVGNYTNSRRFMNLYFHELGLDVAGVKMVDGSGLSRDNHVTAKFLCQFLAAVAKEPYYEDYRNTLGISSQTGDSKVMKPKIPAGCKLVLKSGSMTSVKGYAGYFTNKNGNTYCFAIISNNYDCDNDTINVLLKNIIEEIAKL